jgi:putative PIN family toxin of toxin-antitoxin system
VKDRVVFDCNVFVQTLISPSGPAAVCVDSALQRRVELFLSEKVLAELRDVASRPHLVSRFHLNSSKVEAFIAKITEKATLVDAVPHVFSFDRDPKDEHYIDLAIATGSQLIVSRDKDLLALNDPLDPDGRRFRARFPAIAVLTPVDLLARLAAE